MTAIRELCAAYNFYKDPAEYAELINAIEEMCFNYLNELYKIHREFEVTCGMFRENDFYYDLGKLKFDYLTADGIGLEELPPPFSTSRGNSFFIKFENIESFDKKSTREKVMKESQKRLEKDVVLCKVKLSQAENKLNDFNKKLISELIG